jgi:hypothetical protein
LVFGLTNMSPLRVSALGSPIPRARAEGTGSADGSFSPKHTGSSFQRARAQGNLADFLWAVFVMPAFAPAAAGNSPFFALGDGDWAATGAARKVERMKAERMMDTIENKPARIRIIGLAEGGWRQEPSQSSRAMSMGVAHVPRSNISNGRGHVETAPLMRLTLDRPARCSTSLRHKGLSKAVDVRISLRLRPASRGRAHQ